MPRRLPVRDADPPHSVAADQRAARRSHLHRQAERQPLPQLPLALPGDRRTQHGILVKIPGRSTSTPTRVRSPRPSTNCPSSPSPTCRSPSRAAWAGLVEPHVRQKDDRSDLLLLAGPEHAALRHRPLRDHPEARTAAPCVTGRGQRPFGPALPAGTLHPPAGAFSPFALRLTRTDDDQEFSQLGVTLPPGVPRSSPASACALTPASPRRRNRAGDGAEQIANPPVPPPP